MGFTKIWIDNGEPVIVERTVTDLDEASRILGYADYQDLLDSNHCSDDDSPINFKHTERGYK